MKAFHEATRHLEVEKGVEIKISRLLEKYKEVMLYSDGVPEQFARKQVEELFAKKDDWNYLKAYKEFEEMYPRVTSENPWVSWVSENKTNAGETGTSNNLAEINKKTQREDDRSEDLEETETASNVMNKTNKSSPGKENSGK